MSGKVISLCGVFGKVFGSGLRPSFFLFLPGLPVFSTKLITAQRALSCLVCLFFRPRAHARARARASPASPSLARSLFLPLRLPVSLFSAADSPPDDLTVPPVVFFSRSFVSSPLLPPLRQVSFSRSCHNLLPNGVPYGGHGRSLSFGLSAATRSVLRFGRRRFSVAWLGAFSIIGDRKSVV